MKIKNQIIGVTFFLVLQSIVYGSSALIIDHDCSVDDLIAATLQILHAPDAIKAITIAPGDCYAHPAGWIMEQLIAHFLPMRPIVIGIGDNEGIHPFPADWREDVWKIARLSLWDNQVTLNQFSLELIPSAVSVLEQVLRTTQIPVTMLVTGPCTNIAEVLQKHPELVSKINRIFMMGGAFYVPGNVEQEEHDGTAEWNIYNNPQAFYDLLKSNVPLTLIPLDATQYIPIRTSFMEKLIKCNHLKHVQLVNECLHIIQSIIDSGEYFFWDTLTSAVVINPEIVTTKKMNITVIKDGVSRGRTIETQDGFPVDIALTADLHLFEETVLQVLLGNKNDG